MTSEAKKAAKAKYDAKTAKYYSLKLNTNTDREIIDFLESLGKGNVQTFIKAAIRNNMKNK